MDPHHITALRQAMTRIDARGRFSSADAPPLRALVEELNQKQVAIDHPAHLFGSWRDLEPNARSAFRRMVEDEIVGTMSLFPQGDLWNGLIRGCWELDRYMAESGFLARAKDPLVRWTNRLTGGPMNLRNRLFRRSQNRRWRNAREPSLTAFLVALGRNPSWLLGDFVEGVRVDPRARGYYFDPIKNMAFGYHIGLDLMPTSDGIVCLEANLQGGILDGWLEVQPDNPTVRGILDAALAQGARRVFWIEGNRFPLRTWMLRELLDRARDAGIHAELLEDPRMRRRRGTLPGLAVPNRRSWLTWTPDDTMVVRRNDFPVGSDFVIDHKESFVRGLQAVLRETADTRVRVLPQTCDPQDIPDPPAEGLPNLVYKYPESFAGKGVYFFRARDTGHALVLAREVDSRTGERPGVFQTFVLSDLLSGRRVCDVRGEVFVSPLGTWFLGAYRREASKPLPSHLPEGIADAPGALTSNMSTGGTISRLEGDDVVRFREASIAVGDAIRTVLDRTFETGPPARPSSPLTH